LEFSQGYTAMHGQPVIKTSVIYIGSRLLTSQDSLACPSSREW